MNPIRARSVLHRSPRRSEDAIGELSADGLVPCTLTQLGPKSLAATLRSAISRMAPAAFPALRTPDGKASWEE